MGKHLGKLLGKLLHQIALNCATLHFVKFLTNRAHLPYLPTFSAFPRITMVELEGNEYRKRNHGKQSVLNGLLTYIYAFGETFGYCFRLAML